MRNGGGLTGVESYRLWDPGVFVVAELEIQKSGNQFIFVIVGGCVHHCD